MAKLSVKYGVMGSNKSAELIMTAYKYEKAGLNVLVLKPEIDTKGNDYIVSRIGLKRKVDHVLGKDQSVKDLIPKDTTIILIDECQFLTINQARELYELAIKDDIPTIAYGLRTDFKNEPFPAMSYLLSMAHSIYDLKSICECGKIATVNLRLVNGEVTFEGDTVLIDDKTDVSYKAVCYNCYVKERDEHK